MGSGIARHARAQVRVWRAGRGLGVDEGHLNGRGRDRGGWGGVGWAGTWKASASATIGSESVAIAPSLHYCGAVKECGARISLHRKTASVHVKRTQATAWFMKCMCRALQWRSEHSMQQRAHETGWSAHRSWGSIPGAHPPRLGHASAPPDDATRSHVRLLAGSPNPLLSNSQGREAGRSLARFSGRTPEF